MRPAFFCFSLGFALIGQGGSCRQGKAPSAPAAPTTKQGARTQSTPVAGGKMNKAMNTLPTGGWGGRQIQLNVSESSATVEFDCAHGTIDEPLTLDADNRFDVAGTYEDETGGPAKNVSISNDDGDPRPPAVADNPDHHPARYTGSFNGQTLTLSITLADTKREVGTFSLVRGAAARLHKCLK